MNDERDGVHEKIDGGAAGASSRKVTVTSDRIDSRALFGSARQIIIDHGNDAYTLRLTAQNKLILTK